MPPGLDCGIIPGTALYQKRFDTEGLLIYGDYTDSFEAMMYDKHYYSRCQYLMKTFDVPLYRKNLCVSNF